MPDILTVCSFTDPCSLFKKDSKIKRNNHFFSTWRVYGIFWKIYSLQCYSADMWYLPSVVCGFFLFLVPVWVIIASRSPQIREVLKSGWQPVILAMSISRWDDLSQITVSLPFQCRSAIGATHMYRVFSSSPVLVVWFWIKLWAIQTLRVWQYLLRSSMVSKRRTSQSKYVQKKKLHLSVSS